MLIETGFKYRVPELEVIKTGIPIDKVVIHPYFKIDKEGTVSLSWQEGFAYAFDGPSGPTIDSDELFCPAGAHDPFYQCFRLELLDPKLYRKAIDRFYVNCYLDIMWQRANCEGFAKRNYLKVEALTRGTIHYVGLRVGAASAADPANVRVVKIVPSQARPRKQAA